MSSIATSPELDEILAGCLLGLDDEIEAVRDQLAARGLGEPISVSGGHLADASGTPLYEWRLPSARHDVRPNDAVRVVCEAGESAGFVTAVNRETRGVRIAASDWLGRVPASASLEFDPTWLLGSLRSRLETVRDRPSRFHSATILRLFGRIAPGIGTAEARRPDSGGLNEAQREALARILGSDVQFVWGPPGTGKTKLLGHAAAELAATGKVLVTAITNGAVDEAAYHVAAVLGQGAVGANRIVRVGAELSRTGDSALSLAAALERRLAGGRLTVAIEQLEREAGVRPPPKRPIIFHKARLARLMAVARRLGDQEILEAAAGVSRDLQLQAILALREADLVLTTFARLALWDELAALRFEALVIDEASAAPLPYVALAASRTSGTTVAFGDFQQLPAVVCARSVMASRWLGRDLFRETGIVEETAGEVNLPSPRDRLCAMLDEQYRMAPPIRRLVSELFYGGRLRDAPEIADRPWLTCPLVLVDTGEEGPTVTRAEGSRTNLVHVRLVLRLLEDLASCGIADVAVVAPYRLHVRKLWEAARDQLGPAAPAGLEIATIHRFQGREKSVVVLDTVDAPPGASWFLHEGRNADLPRLMNVALSRARHALVLVGAVEGLRRTLPPDALVNRLVAMVVAEGRAVRARDLGRSVEPASLWSMAKTPVQGDRIPSESTVASQQ
ncbi:MAG: AAA domain-containing protein [Gemmatimonadales bacterium]